MSPRSPGLEGWRRIGCEIALAAVLATLGIALLAGYRPPVTVAWETASEVGTAGFNVYRAPITSTVADLVWRQINPVLIPAKGDEVMGAYYRYEDRDALGGRRYQYWIEEVEWDGTTTRFPDTIRVRAGFSQSWARLEGAALVCFALGLAFHAVRRSRVR